MIKPYAKMTPREHIIETVAGRIKCGRASDVHEAIEGLAAEGESYARAGRQTDSANIYQWYADSTYKQRERLIRAIERKIK